MIKIFLKIKYFVDKGISLINIITNILRIKRQNVIISDDWEINGIVFLVIEDILKLVRCFVQIQGKCIIR